MVSGTHTAQNIRSAAGSLQEDLARLEVQKQALKRELAAVEAHLGSVQRALGALEILMVGPNGEAVADTADVAPARRGQAGPPESKAADDRSDEPSGVEEPQRAKPRSAKKAQPTVGSTLSADEHNKYGKITERIMEYFAGAGDAEVRARDVAAVLGRDTDSGSINGIRSTLDRLVGASRIQRTGRGLYRAVRS